MQCWMDVAFLPIVKMYSWCFILLNTVTLQSAGGKTKHFASGVWLGVKHSASNATWSQTPLPLQLYQQKNTLIPVDRQDPLAGSYYPAPVWHLPSSQERSSLCITKISWINKNLFFKQLKTAGFASYGWGNTKSLGWWIRRGDNIWQEDGEKMLKAATLPPYTARAMHTAKLLWNSLTLWDAEECFTRTCTAKQMKKGNLL